MTTRKPRRKAAKRADGRISKAEQFLEELVGPLTIGSMLESARRCDEISQAEFAQRLGISRANLCDIEKGRKLVSPQRAASFARKLGKLEALWVQVAVEDELKAAGLQFHVKVEAA